MSGNDRDERAKGAALKFEITSEMIEAGAAVLMEDDYLRPLMCSAFAEDYSEHVIRAALAAILDPDDASA